MVKKNLTDVFGLDNVTVIHNAVKPFTDDIVPDEILLKARKDGKISIRQKKRESLRTPTIDGGVFSRMENTLSATSAGYQSRRAWNTL